MSEGTIPAGAYNDLGKRGTLKNRVSSRHFSYVSCNRIKDHISNAEIPVLVLHGASIVRCQPSPDAFSPCEDLLGNWALRGAAWAVGLAALLGNLAVLAVLLAARFRLSVPKLLMCNLALADLCMGLYLLMLAAVDARSLGQYFNYAIDWQKGPGCQVAGFLTVFASELSVYTLTVITGERWYAITHALHLDRRLRLGTAGRVMAAGWLYAVSMAALPLLGVSGYSRTSICLPMENRDAGDTAYLATLLLVNALAFALVCACYARIYCAIRGSGGTRRGGGGAGGATTTAGMDSRGVGPGNATAGAGLTTYSAPSKTTVSSANMDAGTSTTRNTVSRSTVRETEEAFASSKQKVVSLQSTAAKHTFVTLSRLKSWASGAL
ncbi:lutropin-choriogonadotropic hormone receptor-like [Schistocerca cancellata]|uniref:lutropin-choriogonadotropic hormone receptor-like n=1 Tax=Schistocerca cancellata TaxID=274614 RepID=UPI002118F258|nr:lutropin-choriogonadotropic hormone receptor-like [Schistocerca cancellata]